MIEETIKIGHSIKSFGKQGFIKVQIDKPYIDDVKSSRYLFIKAEGFLLPYFIEQFDEESLLIKFDEINSPQDARPLSDSDIYLFASDVTATTIPVQRNVLLGFKLHNQEQLEIGTIQEIIEMPMHTLLKVNTDAGELLVPFHEDLIQHIDIEKQILILEIADGLTDI